MSILLLLLLPTFAQDPVFTEDVIANAANLREQAQSTQGGYEIVESLTVEVGPRMAGTPGDAAAVKWAVAKFKELNFDKVWTEPVTFPRWERGEERAEVVSPYPQELLVTALGYTVGTPNEGLTAEVVEVPSLAALTTTAPEEVAGKIVFINNSMQRTKDGSGYGKAVIARASGAAEAAKLGAAAVVIRSIGTDSHRFPHTGVMRYQDQVARIPAAALSNPDANQLELMLDRGPVTLRLTLTARDLGTATSANVIGEITGRERPEEVVIIGAHLDSWDLGTGALDDGAGVGITMEAARLIGQLDQHPRRTIRVVLYANEESGLYGARAYAEQHENDLENHIIGAESDFGADLIYAFLARVDPASQPVIDAISEQLAPLGIAYAGTQAYGGPDLSPMRERGMPVATLAQDGTDYFDYHHTADDTLDKIDPKKLQQNVAAYAVFAYLAAETPVQFRAREP